MNREQRHTIAQLHKQGSSLRSMARTIEVHVSTVSREPYRNSHKRGYGTQYAQMLADE
nr:helix-turn-helix domain-containing protein [uncultured Porphyromonas sp.]